MKHFIRLAVFLLGFALLVILADCTLIQTDTFVALTLSEMKSRSDIELAVIGSSIVRDHFNAELISEKTGKQAFSAAVPGLSLQGELALTRELYKTNDPAYTVLVLEPYNFDTVKEDPNAQYKLMPFLSDTGNRFDYYLDVCREDGKYLDRLLMFREFGVESLADIRKTVGLHMHAQKTYARLRPTMDGTVSYAGGGFLRHTSGESAETLIRETVLREKDPGYSYEIYDASKSLLTRYKALCEEKGSRLVVMLFPNLTAHALAEPGFPALWRKPDEVLSGKRHPLLQLQYAKAEFWRILTANYYDLYHMNGTGADLFSEAFSRFFNAYAAGEDVSGWFYENSTDYLASIDRITNVWLSVGENEWIADCNRGSLVTPLYRFAAVYADGSETLLRDYSEDGVFSAENIPEGATLKVYAVPQGQEDAEPVWYVVSERSPRLSGS